MRTFEELRGSSASFRRASKRSSSGRLSSLAIAFSSSRLAAYFLTRPLTISLRLTALFLAMSCLASRSALVGGERELELTKQLAGFLVGLRGRRHDDVHAPDLVDLVVVDLREHDVLAQTHGVVAPAVAGGRTQTPDRKSVV